MRKTITILALLFSLASFADNEGSKTTENSSDNSCELKGFVTDKETGDPLTGVMVVLENGMEVYTDFDGRFRFKTVKEGDHNVKISMISYDEVVYKNVKLEKNRTKTIKVALNSVDE